MLKFLTFLLLSFPALADERLLPDLITVQRHLYDWAIDRSTFRNRVLLRFSNGTANIGRGPLEIKGAAIAEGKQEVYQRIYTRSGTFTSRYAGTYVYHPEHRHTHFEDYASYRLREIEGSEGVGPVIASSDKVSFCLYDEYVHNSRLPHYNRNRRYRSCNTNIQGISVGWKDVYGKELADQWIDITEVLPGEYWLESEVDPYNRLIESNEGNNVARIRVRIP